MAAAEQAWLVDASYEPGHITLAFIRADNLQPVKWSNPKFRPYYLAEEGSPESAVRKVDLFTGQERTLAKIEYSTSPPRKAKGWELDIAPALSYAYDNGLRFGVVHELQNNHWTPRTTLTEEDEARFKSLLASISKIDPLKQSLLKEAYSYSVQPVPALGPKTLGLSEDGWSEEEYHRAVLLSRLTNLPLRITYRKYAVSEWIRSILHNYYRAHNILIPTSEELRLGSDKKYVTGALTIAPE